jgi:hypothetical protein
MQLFEDAYLKVRCRVSALVMKSPMTLEPAALRNSLGELPPDSIRPPLQQSLSTSALEVKRTNDLVDRALFVLA